MSTPRIEVETTVNAPVGKVWKSYTKPEDITQWNFASDDWRCPTARVDLREGGQFSSRMEAKDGSMGFDFAGIYTKIVPNQLIEYSFGDRSAKVDFTDQSNATKVHVAFDADPTFPIEHQKGGWQSILNNFKRHVEASK